MELSSFDYSLRWPKSLFLSEARRISMMRNERQLVDIFSYLFSEAFADGGVTERLEQIVEQIAVAGHGDTTKEDVSFQLLDTLLANPESMHEVMPARYTLGTKQPAYTAPRNPKCVAECRAAFSRLVTPDQLRNIFRAEPPPDTSRRRLPCRQRRCYCGGIELPRHGSESCKFIMRGGKKLRHRYMKVFTLSIRPRPTNHGEHHYLHYQLSSTVPLLPPPSSSHHHTPLMEHPPDRASRSSHLGSYLPDGQTALIELRSPVNLLCRH